MSRRWTAGDRADQLRRFAEGCATLERLLDQPGYGACRLRAERLDAATVTQAELSELGLSLPPPPWYANARAVDARQGWPTDEQAAVLQVLGRLREAALSLRSWGEP